MTRVIDPEIPVELRGFEPLTPCLQSRCSNQLSYSPESGGTPSDQVKCSGSTARPAIRAAS